MKRTFFVLVFTVLGMQSNNLVAQEIGAALIAGRINTPGSGSSAGLGVWSLLPLAESKWNIGVSGSYLQSRSEYLVQRGPLGTGPANRTSFTNRLFSASLLVTRDLISKNELFFALGPSIGYSSVGAKEATVMYDRIFAGAWADLGYTISPKVNLHMVLHPRVSPKGNGGSPNAKDPFSGKTLSVFEVWLGASYILGNEE